MRPTAEDPCEQAEAPAVPHHVPERSLIACPGCAGWIEALRLEIRYDFTTHVATCQITLSGDTIDAVARTSREAVASPPQRCGNARGDIKAETKTPRHPPAGMVCAAPPAGFEPAHTAPECIAQDRSHQGALGNALVARAASGGDPPARPPRTAVVRLPCEHPPCRLEPSPRMPGPVHRRPQAQPRARDFARALPVGTGFRQEFPASFQIVSRGLNLVPAPCGRCRKHTPADKAVDEAGRREAAR